MPGDEPREPREPREQPLRIDKHPVHADVLPLISTKPSKPRRVHIRNSVELGYTLDAVAGTCCKQVECPQELFMELV